MLSIGDLNQIIKYYAFNVQQRIEQLEHFNCYSQYDQQNEQQYEFIAIISKYNNYVTKEEKEVKFAKKLKERVIQIFQYFKNKSNNQNLLTIIQQKIDQQLSNFISNPPIKLGQFFSYVHLISKRGCIIRPPAQKKRIVSRSILKEPLKLEEKITPSFSVFNIKKRTVSIIGSNKHLKASTSVQKQKWRLEDAINGIWNVLDLQKMNLVRIKEGNELNILKESLRRNQKILSVIKKNEKRKNRRAVTTQDCQKIDELAILTEMKLNTIKQAQTYKKRRPILASRKKHDSIKQNISFV